MLKIPLSPDNRKQGDFICYLSDFMIFYLCRPSDSIFMGKEVIPMEMLVSFMLSVAAGVISYYICKWLDEQFKAGKH